MPKKNTTEKMSSPPRIPISSISLVNSTVKYSQSHIGNIGICGDGNETVEVNCPGIKEIVGHVAKLERKVNDQEKVIQSKDKTISELLQTSQTNRELALKNTAYQNEIKEVKLEIMIQRDVNKQIRSTLQSLQSKHNEVCEILDNERKTVQKLEEELSLTKLNQDAVLKKQLEKLKDQFKRMIASFEREPRIQSSEDVSDLSTAQSTNGKPKKKTRSKKKRDKEEPV